ncbi:MULTISPECIES: ABC transporter substrate-binding protein [Rhizobium]|uniref:Glutathione-binding protein GsiB n=1 Tax=Rhizobium rhododendri TaxID=2506430 RepID=A0ABY8IW30_9HYPH|nr:MULTISPECIES: ABC transporter substrate-binding protein [Rhizobium]MBZ5759411.1 ABC transporter substrate-binding protein [Rhizobium sp. VS19-DR96]MBZ5765856.1 ABC transporter substrate-binding protein [Rhizobium sp. VS19-DR129.2]MBZ5773940.1 ABC transporter substrate-binding protein [Rhizobium sp. VS19-DRK62.2]MBZ5785012.1 ABC transporter substrate-binding protein [Rhizobium sp. VS19-DR121]MBZ5801911.1 ABC transporter substrate-binding protein [Rhizobium sp. VS19-DR181]
MTKTFLRRAALAAMLATTSLVPALAVQAADKPVDGGKIVVTYKDDIATLDPAIGYDWQNWSMINAMFSRLVDYTPGTTELKPSLAESYTVSEDGKTYTFKLRAGVKFTNGREVTAADVKYSIERAVNPKTQGPGAGFFHSIVGSDAMTAGTSQTLDGITVVDDHTVKFTLVQPDATFLNVLALNFSSVVPKEAVEAANGDFGKKPVGSGAFILKEWTVGQRLVFEKNPDYFVKDRPHIDGYTVEIGQEPLVALLRLQKGEVDVAGDGIPPAKYLEMKNSKDFEGMIVDRQQLETSYVTLNTQVKPLDNVKVRQALNMAVNKERIVRIINGRAVPANQVLPPLMPGYDKDYKGYAYSVEKAKALLAEAGLKDGFTTQLYTSNTDPQPRIAQAIQQDLAAVGVKVEIKALANPNVIAAGGTQGQAPMAWSGGLGWIADFPDPSDFYGPILGCGSAVAGGWNWSWYCNKEIEPRAQAADAMPLPAKAAERNEAWKKIFTEIQEKDAPWIPVFNERRVVAKSKRMGGPDEIYIDPTRVIDYEAIFVKK